MTGTVQTPAGGVPRVCSELTGRDMWGAFKVRWNVGRMNYTVDPGLYALGQPDRDSPVLVTANYKLSFDRLRGALPGTDAWILVLDTKGINVWCAAGKGTFGTAELVQRVQSSGLSRVVSHRRLILPQLSAPGVAAHQVTGASGFEVTYGPVRAADLPAFLDNGFKATPAMRRKTFTLRERAVLIPIELVAALKWCLILAAAFFLAGGLGGAGGYWRTALDRGPFAVSVLLASLTAGAVLSPLLLPWLPGRAFALKGLFMGLITAAGLLVFRRHDLVAMQGGLEMAGWSLMVPAVSAYLAMNFTGASTYTSLSGVKKEMRWALPVEIFLGAAGVCLWLGSRFAA